MRQTKPDRCGFDPDPCHTVYEERPLSADRGQGRHGVALTPTPVTWYTKRGLSVLREAKGVTLIPSPVNTVCLERILWY